VNNLFTKSLCRMPSCCLQAPYFGLSDQPAAPVRFSDRCIDAEISQEISRVYIK